MCFYSFSGYIERICKRAYTLLLSTISICITWTEDEGPIEGHPDQGRSARGLEAEEEERHVKCRLGGKEVEQDESREQEPWESTGNIEPVAQRDSLLGLRYHSRGNSAR